MKTKITITMTVERSTLHGMEKNLEGVLPNAAKIAELFTLTQGAILPVTFAPNGVNKKDECTVKFDDA